ncbi:MAG: NAD-dependent epimerase/dehydratase family protein [bacterium]|nr:NAD-dependent epimerase/dehydratase family protein [bacterium]
MNLLVTGGAGFIGSHLTDALIKEKHQVAVLDNLSTGRKENLNSAAGFYQLDLEKDNLAGVFKKEKPAVVFHLAAQVNLRRSLENPVWDAEQNILGSLRLFEAAAKAGARRIIFISTGGAMCPSGPFPFKETDQPSPLSPYGLAKLATENYFLNYYQKTRGIKTAVLRLANVYGPRQDAKGEAGVVAIFRDRLKRNLPLLVNGHGRQTRDYIFVRDVVEGCLACLNKKAVGVFHLGTGQETTVNQIAAGLLSLSKSKVKIQHGPAIVGEALRSVLDPRKAKRVLGWQARVGLEEGMRRTWEDFRK